MQPPVGQIISTISEPGAASAPRGGFTLFRSGFRPFFLFGALFGLSALVYFILLMSGVAQLLPSRWDMVFWHQHEMLFGFAGAIIAGFLLTAVPNWTGHPTPRGAKLALLVLLWLLGRAAVFDSAHLPAILAGAVDVAFFPACIAGILPALVKSHNRRNYFFIVLLVLLTLGNGLTHWGNEDTGMLLAKNIIILIMVMMGGRVIPFFTENPLGIRIARSPRIERFALISTIAALALEVMGANTHLLGVAFILAAAANFWRFSRWHSIKTLRVPLLWVLHAGYAWLIVGMAMKAGHNFGADIPLSADTHAFTAGGVGTLTLGMMARVSLGHSGRMLAAGRLIVFAFACITLAALLRVFGVWLMPGLAMQWFQSAALFWMLAFGIFLWVYAPILLRPRRDGRDG